MPLQMHTEEDYTSRPTIVAWDHNVDTESREALSQIADYLGRGFRVLSEGPGEVRFAPPPRPMNLGIMRVLTKNGDDRITWDRGNEEEIAEAITKFDELKAKGYTAFSVTSDGKKGHEIDLFDPGAEEVLMVPQTRPS